MIDLNNFMVNTAPSPDLVTESPTTTDIELSTDKSEDSNQRDEVVDSDSFIVLMTQIISTLPVENSAKAPANPEASEDNAISPDNIMGHSSISEGDSSQLNTAMLDDNVAMAWINLASFQPPKAVNETDLESESIKDLNIFEEGIADSNVVEYLEAESLPQDKKTMNFNTDFQGNEDVSENEKFQDKETIDITSDITGFSTKDDLLNLKATSPTTSEIKHSGVDQKLNPEHITVENNQNLANSLNTKESSNLQTDSTLAKTLDIPVDINNSKWADRFSEHIIWLESQGIKSALIKIHPEDLGPLEISIKVVKDSASINISSPNNHVRDIVDQALPRLREMMADQGLNLADVHISADANSRHSAQQDRNNEELLIPSQEEEANLIPLNSRVTKGLIDYFA